MPLSRYLVRNEYGLADPDLYRAADKDDPEALLEGVAMAGLVGVLRQLGDLAEFAAEMFHDLHEEVMGTAARGHALIARVQQLEAEFPLAEKTLLSQTSHIPFLYSSGIDWHPSIRMDEDLVTQGDMPRFVMDSYEECRGPPRLFLLDKFDVAGAGACLKRYTDPSFCKAESAEFSIKKSEGQREKRVRKVKRRGSQWRNGGTPEGFPSSHAKLHQLLLEERIETGANDPERRVKLKKRQLDGFKREDELKSYMQKFMDTYSSDNKVVHEISLDLVPMNLESNCDTCQSGLEIVEIDTFSPSREPYYRDKAAYSSFNMPEVVKPPVHELNEVIDGRTMEIPGAHYEAGADNLSLCNKDVTNEELAADTGSKSGGSLGEYNVDDVASEIDNYVDALANMESETETDSDYRTKRDQRYLNSSEEKQQQNTFLDYHSVGNSTISDDGSLLKKDIDSFSCSDNVSNIAEDATGEPTAKSFTTGPMSPFAVDEKSITREAQGTDIKEYIASDDAESMGKNPLVQSDKFKELPWISVNAGTALTKKGNEGMEQTDQESKEQVVAHVVPNDDYDHLLSVGISPVDEMGDASSESSFDVSLGHSLMPEETSSHPQSEYARDGELTLFIEMKCDSSASSPARNPIRDLSQPVEATSDGLLVPQRPSVSVLNHPEPVYVPCEDNDSTPIAEEKSEDPSRLLEIVEPMLSVASDVDGIVEPRASKAADREDSSALIADHSDRESQALEIHYPLEPLCFEGSESTRRHEFDTSENEVAHFVDESSGFTVCESTGEKTDMNGEDSCNLNLVENPSQAHSQSDQVSKIPNAPVLFDGQMAKAGFHLSLDQLGSAPVSSSPACLFYDASEPLQAEGDTISVDDVTHGKDAASDSRSKHLPEQKNDLDLDHSVQVSDQTETKCLQLENTKTERQSLSSVFDCSSTWYKESISIGEDPYQNSEGSQAEMDLQNPGSRGRDDCVNSDSIVCDTSIVLGLADNVPETCLSVGSQTSLSPTSPEEAPLSSIECEQHLERTNSSHHHSVEDEEHIVDAFENVNTQTQITLNKALETRGVEMTAESFNATERTSQPLEYVEQILPPEDSGNGMCINPISASSLCAPSSQPVVSNLSVQSSNYKVESPLVEEEPSAFSVSVSPPMEPLLAEASAPSADHKQKSTWKAREQSPADFSSNNVRPAEAQASLKVENPGHTIDLSHTNLPLFGTFPNPTHVKPGEMPPLPPLPPIQWRLGRNQHTSLASEGLMQHPFGARQRLDHSETSDNAGVRSQNYLGAQPQNPFLSLSDEGANIHHVTGYSDRYVQQPTGSMFSMPNISHEDGPQFISLDQRPDAQIFTGSQDDLLLPASDARMDKFSLEPFGSGLMTDDATPESPAFFQTETTVAHEHIFSPAEQETTGVDEQLEYKEEKEIATTSAQFEPPLSMHYGHQLSRGFVAPEAQEMWSADEFGIIKPENVNGSLQKKIQRPRNPLIDAVVAVDKSKLRKVGEIVKPQDQPEAENREQHLPQLRKVGERVKFQDAVKDEERFQNFPPLRKIGERVKPHDLPSTETSVPHLPLLRKVEERIKAPDEPKAEDEEQSFLPLRGVGGRLKPQDEPQPENRDWLEQIRNQSFNLKRPTTSRPSIQGRQTNLRVSAILEKANMIRQAIAGNDEDDSDGWSDS